MASLALRCSINDISLSGSWNVNMRDSKPWPISRIETFFFFFSFFFRTETCSRPPSHCRSRDWQKNSGKLEHGGKWSHIILYNTEKTYSGLSGGIWGGGECTTIYSLDETSILLKVKTIADLPVSCSLEWDQI